MEPNAPILANGSLFEDRYEILGELGSGSFSRVYEARPRSTGHSNVQLLLTGNTIPYVSVPRAQSPCRL